MQYSPRTDPLRERVILSRIRNDGDMLNNCAHHIERHAVILYASMFFIVKPLRPFFVQNTDVWLRVRGDKYLDTIQCIF